MKWDSEESPAWEHPGKRELLCCYFPPQASAPSQEPQVARKGTKGVLFRRDAPAAGTAQPRGFWAPPPGRLPTVQDAHNCWLFACCPPAGRQMNRCSSVVTDFRSWLPNYPRSWGAVSNLCMRHCRWRPKEAKTLLVCQCLLMCFTPAENNWNSNVTKCHLLDHTKIVTGLAKYVQKLSPKSYKIQGSFYDL